MVMMITKIIMAKRPELVEELGGSALWGLGRTGGLDCSCAPAHHHHHHHHDWDDDED